MPAPEKAKGFMGEFKAFIARGNVMDMAVGVIIGGAFGKISTSLVNDIIMPLISMLTGGIDFSNWKIVLKQAVAGADGVIDASTEVAVRYGTFLATILDFLIIAFAVFLMIKTINGFHDKMKKQEEEAPAEPPAPPEPSAEEKLLTEIRDLLKEQKLWKRFCERVWPSWAWTKAVPPPCCGTGSCCWKKTRS